MSVVLHISDTHFGTEQVAVMQALLHLAHAQRPNLLLVSGDITQRARRAQFRAAAAFIEQLAIPARVIIAGNHDIPLFNLAARIVHPFANFQRAFGNDLEPEFESDDLLVLTVNSTRPERHKNGVIDTRQIERVAARLRTASPRQLRLVAMHHPVCAITASDQRNLVRGHKAAIECWSAAGADMIAGGHIHLPYVRTLGEDLPRAVWALQAGTAISRRTRGNLPNSVNILRIGTPTHAAAVSIERWDYQPTAAIFNCGDTVSITPDRG